MEYNIKITGSGTLEEIAESLLDLADVIELTRIATSRRGEAENPTLFISVQPENPEQ